MAPPTRPVRPWLGPPQGPGLPDVLGPTDVGNHSLASAAGHPGPQCLGKGETPAGSGSLAPWTGPAPGKAPAVCLDPLVCKPGRGCRGQPPSPQAGGEPCPQRGLGSGRTRAPGVRLAVSLPPPRSWGRCAARTAVPDTQLAAPTFGEDWKSGTSSPSRDVAPRGCHSPRRSGRMRDGPS